MSRNNSSSDAFTGLEAAIVLIAFVVVAAVFSYVVLGAGFFTTQKSQETVYKSVEQATSNLQVVGGVYGTTDGGTDTTIKHIEFNLGLGPGASPIDLSKMTIVVSQSTDTAIKQLKYGATASDTVFSVSSTITADPIVDGTLKNQQQARINFDVSPPIPRNGRVTIEIRPPVGASLQFSKSAPANIQALQILS
jgi:archaeal flagellin FlaB